MKALYFPLFIICMGLQTIAQNSNKAVFAFTITDYINNPNDSVSIVQIHIPYNVAIEQKQVGLLKRNYNNNGKTDTATVGVGRCNLIKGQYYYFGLKLNKAGNYAKTGDILYTQINYPVSYKGYIYSLTKNAIYLKNIYDSTFYNFETAQTLSEPDDNKIIAEFAIDIANTGKEMVKQMPDQNQLVKGGLFSGKKLFDAMQAVTSEDVVKFLKYVNARPRLYTGNGWKISEIFATWMVSETPTVIE